MKTKKLSNRIISLLLTSSLVFPMLLSNTTLAYQDMAAIDWMEHGPDPVPAPIPDVSHELPTEAEDTRTLDDLIEAGFVRLDEDGNIAMIQVSDESGITSFDWQG